MLFPFLKFPLLFQQSAAVLLRRCRKAYACNPPSKVLSFFGKHTGSGFLLGSLLLEPRRSSLSRSLGFTLRLGYSISPGRFTRASVLSVVQIRVEELAFEGNLVPVPISVQLCMPCVCVPKLVRVCERKRKHLWFISAAT